MNIGILGATIYNPNLGCQALAWSLISLLQQIAKDNNFSFHYYVFDRIIDKKTTESFCKIMSVNESSFDIKYASTIKFYRVKRNVTFLKELSKCEVVIDITQGDSFSDIYGKIQFWRYTLEKIAVQKKNIPLILGPQTYGPYKDSIIKRVASRVINKSALVIARDDFSARYAEEIGHRDVIRGIDLAFLLPFAKKNNPTNASKVIGVNPSELLWNQSSAPGSVGIKYKTDYKQYLRKLLSFLTDSGYDVRLISHVSDDIDVANELHIEYPDAKVVPFFKNAYEAKSYIAHLDCFIGSRMHATIAAISSGVPVIPVSYSRKFEGLFNTLEYNHVVSLAKLNTDECFWQTTKELKELSLLKADTQKASKIIEERLCSIKKNLSDSLKMINSKGKG